MMKKVSVILLLLISLSSFQAGSFVDDERDGSKCKKGELIWQKQLSLIIDNNDRIKDNGLTLNSYRYIGKIGSIDELEKIKSDIYENAVFPVYLSSDSFEISKTNSLSFEEFNSMLSGLIPVSKQFMIDTKSSPHIFQCLFEVGDMSTVELEWIYKGDKLNTVALVSDKKGIVYDNLLYFIHFVTGSQVSHMVK